MALPGKRLLSVEFSARITKDEPAYNLITHRQPLLILERRCTELRQQHRQRNQPNLKSE